MGWESERDSEMGRSNNMRERERERERDGIVVVLN